METFSKVTDSVSTRFVYCFLNRRIRIWKNWIAFVYFKNWVHGMHAIWAHSSSIFLSTFYKYLSIATSCASMIACDLLVRVVCVCLFVRMCARVCARTYRCGLVSGIGWNTNLLVLFVEIESKSCQSVSLLHMVLMFTFLICIHISCLINSCIVIIWT